MATRAGTQHTSDASPSRTMVSRWRRYLGVGLDLVFPPACAFCHAEIDSSADGLLCPSCRGDLVDRRTACPRCGASGPPAGTTVNCPRCKDERCHYEFVVRLGSYDGDLRTAVLRIKEARQRALAMALGDLLVNTRGEQLAIRKPDAIVPVPMHWSRRLWRGTNSPQTIAERLSVLLNIPLAGHLLARRRRTAPQASLSANKRLANVRGAFRAASHPDLAGARLLLVDDIMTTGATVNEAAKMLSRAGASSIGIVVLARAEGLV